MYVKSSSFENLEFEENKIADPILIIPAKIYALTGDTSANAVIYINNKAPHFECIFDLMSMEAKQRILDDIEFASKAKIPFVEVRREENKQKLLKSR